MGEKKGLQSVQVFGRKKTATAVAHCKRGKGLVKVNGRPLHLVEPRTLRQKLEEPLLLLGKDRFSAVDIRVRVNGGGHIAQVYGTSLGVRNLSDDYFSEVGRCLTVDSKIIALASFLLLALLGVWQELVDLFVRQLIRRSSFFTLPLVCNPSLDLPGGRGKDYRGYIKCIAFVYGYWVCAVIQ